MRNPDIQALLCSLRQHALAKNIANLGSHQVNAHWSLAYACEQPPEPWEICRAPPLHLMPSTVFFSGHQPEIQEALKPKATWDLLHLHAAEKIALDSGMTDQERRSHGYIGKV